jgi:hypothetical protein
VVREVHDVDTLTAYRDARTLLAIVWVTTNVNR